VARILLAADRPTQGLDVVLFLSKHRERDLQIYAGVDPNPRPQGVSQIKEQQRPTFFCAQATSGSHLLLPLFLFYFTLHCIIFLFFFLSYASSLPIPCLVFIFPYSLLCCTHTQPCFNFTYSCHLFLKFSTSCAVILLHTVQSVSALFHLSLYPIVLSDFVHVHLFYAPRTLSSKPNIYILNP
jgi:hypothetical protein